MREEAATPLIMRWGDDREGGAAGPHSHQMVFRRRWFIWTHWILSLYRLARFRGHCSHRVDCACAPQTREYIDWRWLLSCVYIEITHEPLFSRNILTVLKETLTECVLYVLCSVVSGVCFSFVLWSIL